MPRTVLDPDGTTWVVRRRWLPRLGRETLWGRVRRRFRQTRERSTDMADVPDVGCFGDAGEAIVVAIAVVVAVAFLVVVGIPLLVALFDLLLLLVLGIVGVLARVLFRRPWIVEAISTDDDRMHRWRVVGWRASEATCASVADQLEAGIVLPSDDA